MLKGLRTFIEGIAVGANIVTIALMLLTGFSGMVSPEVLSWTVAAGLVFPCFAAANALFLVVWLVVSPRRAVIPFVGFIAAYLPMRTYCPLNISKSAPPGALKVVTFNVENLDKKKYPPGDDGLCPALSYVRQQDADIVCMQECNLKDDMMSAMHAYYEHIDSVKPEAKAAAVVVMSRYPIVKKEHLRYATKGNPSAAFHLLIDGDTVVVVDCHLETNSFTVDERAEFGHLMSQTKANLERHNRLEVSDTMTTTTRILLDKMRDAAVTRAPQARTVARYIDSLRHLPIIVCGDFNDNPLSYARRTVGHGLTDCYVASGNGPGWSYNKYSMRVRIDNMFCSRHFTPYQCTVDKGITASDHYPVVCYLMRADDEH